MAIPVVRSVYERHKLFAVLTSIGFALLYAELGVFAHAAWPARSDGEAALIIGGAFVVSLTAFLLSFGQARSFSVPGAEQLQLPALARVSAHG